jgi:hypothetical protein
MSNNASIRVAYCGGIGLEAEPLRPFDGTPGYTLVQGQ